MSVDPVVPLAAGDALARLAQAVRGAEVDAGTLTDEELLLMAGTAGDPEPHYDAPRLSLLPAEQRALAVATTLRVLRARELAQPVAGGGVRLAGLPGVVGEVRSRAELVARVRIDVRGGALRRAVVYRARWDLFLSERVTPGGLHAFTFRALDAQARWLALAVAPDLHGGRTEPVRTYAAPQELEASSEELAAASDVAALVVSGSARAPHAHSFHAFSDAGGVQVLQGRGARDGGITLQRLSAHGLVEFCADFLSRAGG